jgi:hypothetical protein
LRRAAGAHRHLASLSDVVVDVDVVVNFDGDGGVDGDVTL